MLRRHSPLFESNYSHVFFRSFDHTTLLSSPFLWKIHCWKTFRDKKNGLSCEYVHLLLLFWGKMFTSNLECVVLEIQQQTSEKLFSQHGSLKCLGNKVLLIKSRTGSFLWQSFPSPKKSTSHAVIKYTKSRPEWFSVRRKSTTPPPLNSWFTSCSFLENCSLQSCKENIKSKRAKWNLLTLWKGEAHPSRKLVQLVGEKFSALFPTPLLPTPSSFLPGEWGS